MGDKPSFMGDKDFLTNARKSTQLPALRKDFMYDTYQVTEARALNADCILIIMASVSDRLIVSESGLFNTEDLRSMAELDVRSFLIGESLMRQPDVKTATQKILSNPLRP